MRREIVDPLAFATLSSHSRYSGVTRYPSVFIVFAVALGRPRFGAALEAAGFAFAMTRPRFRGRQYSESPPIARRPCENFP
jgi:hypothetical protein